MPELLQDLAEEPFHPIADSLFLCSRLPATFNVLIVFSMIHVATCDGSNAAPGKPAYTACRTADTPRPSRGARGCRLAKPNGRVGVLDVLFGASSSLSVGNSAAPNCSANSGCGPSSVRNPLAHPTAGGDAKRFGGPPRCLVCAGLAAADHLFEHD